MRTHDDGSSSLRRVRRLARVLTHGGARGGGGGRARRHGQAEGCRGIAGARGRCRGRRDHRRHGGEVPARRACREGPGVGVQQRRFRARRGQVRVEAAVEIVRVTRVMKGVQTSSS